MVGAALASDIRAITVLPLAMAPRGCGGSYYRCHGSIVISVTALNGHHTNVEVLC